MPGETVIRSLTDHFELLRRNGAPDHLTRHMEAHARDWAEGLDVEQRERVTERYLHYLAEHLPEGLRSPLVRSPERRAAVERAAHEFLALLEQDDPALELAATPQFVRQFAAMAGLGLLEPLMDDPETSEIIVENYRSVLIEKRGLTVPVEGLEFASEEALRRQAIALCTLSNRPLGRDNPMQSFFFSDGSRVTVVIGPDVAHKGTVLNIRRKKQAGYRLDDLRALQALSAEVQAYLEQVVRAWANVVVCGESGSGKTTVLQALVDTISPRDRGVIIEENAELDPRHPHMRYLLANPEVRGATLRDCTRMAMLIAPRRLILGEAKEGEVADMLFAMTSGFSGCMTTIHSDPGASALDRLYVAAMMDPHRRFGAGGEVLWRTIVQAVDVVVHVAFSPRGRRHIDAVHEVWGLDEASGRPDLRPAWQATYDEDACGEITWARDKAYEMSPRLVARMKASRARLALEQGDLPETPIEEARRLERAYQAAVALGNAGLYDEALGQLEAIQGESPGYRDVERLAREYRLRLEEAGELLSGQVEKLRAGARDALARGDEDTARWYLEELAGIAPAEAEALREELGQEAGEE